MVAGSRGILITRRYPDGRNRLITYQLVIRLAQSSTVRIGRLGVFEMPAGVYVYTGSARRNLEARIRRHLSHEKRLHWHVDYLLGHPDARVIDVFRFAEPECEVNARTPGRCLVPGFGASDCRHGCGSHLKFQGEPSA
jgi:Uri superfamily endonuclease